MSIIQSLREKGAWIMTAVIAFALLVFVVEEGLRNKTMFGDSSNTLGKVNGTTIDRIKFEERLKRIEDRYTQMGYNMDDNSRMQERNRLWNEYVDDAVLNDEYEKLGIEVTEKELGDYLYGANPPQDFKQQFTDPNTGQFDAIQAHQYVQQLKKQSSTNPQRALLFDEYFPAIVKFRMREKLEAMMTNSVYVPKWLIEKTSAENSQIASFSYVRVPYTSIPDSTIKVSDADVNEFIAKNKTLFKQEKAAGIDYVYFNAAPSKADTNAVVQSLENIKDSFARTNDVAQLLLTEGTITPYFNSYLTRKEIKIASIDSIINRPAGTAYGPYMDAGTYVLGRVVDIKMIPEMVKVRHILVATMQQTQTGQMVPVREETVAKNLIDSIANAIKTGSNFDTLCLKFSDDGTKTTGGIYDSVVTGKMVVAFNDYIFTNPIGSKGVVKTEYGYHYIEILANRGPIVPGYKVAYLSKPILPSDETDNNARGAANQFAAESRNKKQFEENAKKKNLEVFNAAEIKPLDPSIRGVGIDGGSSRELIRWIFNDAELGDVSERPFQIKSSNYFVYVVPVVTHLYEEGTQGVERARQTSEAKIRQQKKAKIIGEKIASATTLEEVSKATNEPIAKADSVSFSSPQSVIGYEPKLSGAAFNKSYQSKISPVIAGEVGVFVIKTESVGAIPNPNLDVKSQQAAQQQQMRMFNQRSIVENLKKSASIKDNRYKHF